MFLEPAPSSEKCLDLKDTFAFSCHKDLACFNTCCRNKHLPLTPYDILRLKNALNLHSDEFLSRYTVYSLDQDSGFPIISLGMGDAPQKACPFVAPEGCRVYNDRPMACRLFPLGRLSGIDHGRMAKEEFYYLLDIPGCLGFGEKKIRTVEEWRNNQGLLPYTEINDRMLDLVFHPGRDRTKPLDERQLQKVMVACYNLDVFREFVFETGFLDSYEIDKETCSKIKNDDTDLLNLGFAYLGRALFQ
ncbi:MAG: YkgJ family cysteine cluster protein [Deltaproteobacteria bacterium]|nr:YkgJ family cysteine cluster protein [Deltaproteobacteria bacterium]